MAWRLALTVALCAAVGITLHLAWVAGYRANPDHHRQPIVARDTFVGIITHLTTWWRYLLPTFILVGTSVFHELAGDAGSAVADWVFGRLLQVFRTNPPQHPHHHHGRHPH